MAADFGSDKSGGMAGTEGKAGADSGGSFETGGGSEHSQGGGYGGFAGDKGSLELGGASTGGKSETGLEGTPHDALGLPAPEFGIHTSPETRMASAADWNRVGKGLGGIAAQGIIGQEGQQRNPWVGWIAKPVTVLAPVVGAILSLASFIGASPVHTSTAYEGGVSGSMEGGAGAGTGATGTPTYASDGGYSGNPIEAMLGGGGGGSGKGLGIGQGRALISQGNKNYLWLGLLLILAAIGVGYYYTQKKGKK